MRYSILSVGLLVMTGFIDYKFPVKIETVPGKIYFSNKPFLTTNSGSKSNFTSADYIYGRIESDNQTIPVSIYF